MISPANEAVMIAFAISQSFLVTPDIADSNAATQLEALALMPEPNLLHLFLLDS